MSNKTSKSFDTFELILRTHIKTSFELMQMVKKDKINVSEHLGMLNLITKATVVTSIAAFDRYFTDRFIEAFIPFIKKYKVNKDFSLFLGKKGLDLCETLNLLKYARPIIRIKSLLSNILEKYVTQSENNINDLYKHYHINEILINAEKKAKRKTLIRNTKILIRLRNEIVHNTCTNQYGKPKFYTINQMTKFNNHIKDLLILVLRCDEIIMNKRI